VENVGKLWPAFPRKWTASEACSQVSGEERVRVPAVMRACSGCAGEYEDPERTAWTAGEGDDSEDEQPFGVVDEEFPAD
jgi:hypothetical protein